MVEMLSLFAFVVALFGVGAGTVDIAHTTVVNQQLASVVETTAGGCPAAIELAKKGITSGTQSAGTEEIGDKCVAARYDSKKVRKGEKNPKKNSKNYACVGKIIVVSLSEGKTVESWLAGFIGTEPKAGTCKCIKGCDAKKKKEVAKRLTEKALQQMMEAYKQKDFDSKTFSDPNGVLVPLSDKEIAAILADPQSQKERYVSIPKEEFANIARDIPSRIDAIAQDAFGGEGTAWMAEPNANMIHNADYLGHDEFVPMEMTDRGVIIGKMKSVTYPGLEFSAQPSTFINADVKTDSGSLSGPYFQPDQQVSKMPVYDTWWSWVTSIIDRGRDRM